MTDRPAFIAALADRLIQHWPAGMTGDEALGFLVGVTELAFPPVGEAVETGAAEAEDADARVEDGADSAEDPGAPVHFDRDRFDRLSAEPPAVLHPDHPGKVSIPPQVRPRIQEFDIDDPDGPRPTPPVAAPVQPAPAPVSDGAEWTRERDAELCRLRLGEGLTWPEIGRRTGRSPGACQQRALALRKMDRWYIDVTDRVLSQVGGGSSLGGVV